MTPLLLIAALAAPDLDARLSAFGLDADARETLAAGGVAHASIDATAADELALAIAAVVPGDLDRLAAMLRDGRFLAADPDVRRVVPIERSDAPPGPADAYARAAAADRVVAPAAARLLDALAAGPDAAEDVEHRWFRAHRLVDGRVEPVIVHVALLAAEDAIVTVERHLSTTGSYQSFHAVRLLVPVDRGVAILARCRTGVERVDGIGGAVRRALGRRKMRQALEAHLERLAETE